MLVRESSGADKRLRTEGARYRPRYNYNRPHDPVLRILPADSEGVDACLV